MAELEDTAASGMPQYAPPLPQPQYAPPPQPTQPQYYTLPQHHYYAPSQQYTTSAAVSPESPETRQLIARRDDAATAAIMEPTVGRQLILNAAERALSDRRNRKRSSFA